MFFLAKTITTPSWSKFYQRSGLQCSGQKRRPLNRRPLNRGHEYGDDGDEGDDVVALHNGDDGWKS